MTKAEFMEAIQCIPDNAEIIVDIQVTCRGKDWIKRVTYDYKDNTVALIPEDSEDDYEGVNDMDNIWLDDRFKQYKEYN